MMIVLGFHYSLFHFVNTADLDTTGKVDTRVINCNVVRIVPALSA